MPMNTDYPIQKSSSRLRLQFLVQLRWLAVAGQLLTIYIASWVMGFKFNWVVCLGLVSISVWLNIVLRMYYPARTRLNLKFATNLLLYDMASIAVLIFMTGGIQNPFAIMIIGPSIIAAWTLPLSRTGFIAAMTIIVVAFLVWVHEPLPWFPSEEIEFPLTFRFAMAGSLLATLLYISAAAYLLSMESRRMSAALAATETVLAREQQLNALDGLAAAAAHELGTPLGTIYMTSKELLRNKSLDSEVAADLELIGSQAERCRAILTKLTRSPEDSDALLTTMTLSELVQEASEPFQFGDISIHVIAEELNKDGAGAGASFEPVSNRNPGVLYGLGNLIENAVDFADAAVSITASWTDADVFIVLADDGPGFPPEILDTLGEPFITTRSASQVPMELSDGSGLGLGFFIAKTLLERSGATLTLANRIHPEQGAVIRITWPREKFEADAIAISEAPATGKRPPAKKNKSELKQKA